MKSLYIETSAILSWLMGEKEGRDVVALINNSEHVVSSVLSHLETERALIRAENEKIIKSADRQKIRGMYKSVSSSWSYIEMTVEIIERASQSFPVEPVRSLDAIHLATALESLQLYPEIKLLSFDKRIVANIVPLGLERAIP